VYLNTIETVAAKYGNVVRFDSDGAVAGIFVRFNKCLSSDLDPSLPAHVHPAFIVNGVEQDYILLGKYKAGVVESGERLLSLPGVNPINAITRDALLRRMRAAGDGISGMTIADQGFIKLLAQKNGWRPQGNVQYGYDTETGYYVWVADNGNVAVDAKRVFDGWLYTCLQAHRRTAELQPDISPTYWRREKFIGGWMHGAVGDGTHRVPFRTLNGTGPREWYLGDDEGSMADLIGSCFEVGYGYRLVDMELQVLENNDAADPEADLSATSGAWRAILPHAADDGYDLVAPGTEGTLKWNLSGTKFSLDTVANTTGEWKGNWFVGGYTANSATVPHVPHILKELGLYPSDAASGNMGRVSMNYASGENMLRVWNTFSDGNYAGIARKYDCFRSTYNISCSARMRAMES